MVRLAAVVAAVMAGLLVVGVMSASAARRPTRSERRALARALNNFELGADTFKSASVSTVSPQWAMAQCGYQCDQDGDHYGFALFHWTRHGWNQFGPYTAVVRNHVVELCAYAPAKVIADLFQIICPPWRALHARHATTGEKTQLTEALDTWAKDHYTWEFLAACVSRLDPTWGAVYVTASSPYDPFEAWFHHVDGRWVLESGPNYQHEAESPAVHLSLDRCVFS